MTSDNPSGAGNQQERPGLEQWVVGFVDGEAYPLITAKAVSIPGILRGHTPTSSVRRRVEDMVLAPWRHGES